jgi:hypothetical protein
MSQSLGVIALILFVAGISFVLSTEVSKPSKIAPADGVQYSIGALGSQLSRGTTLKTNGPNTSSRPSS